MDRSPSLGVSDRRVLVANACRVLGARGLAEDVLGHISLRTGPDRMLVRCRGPQEEGLFLTQPADVREVDLDGHWVGGEVSAGDFGLAGSDGTGGGGAAWAVPNELPIHAEILRARPDVDAVVHCHPPAVLLAGLEGVPLRPVFGAYNIPAARLALDGVPVYPRSVLVRRPELGREVAAAMGDAPVLVLRGHGIATVGSGPHAVEQAVVRALALDALARVSLESARLGGRAADLPPEDVAELPDLGGSFNDVMMFRHHLARLRHEGLLLQ
jgi:ribulose-5-phosphate 4-epimerase/fuculose-1-phosphate aldolase